MSQDPGSPARAAALAGALRPLEIVISINSAWNIFNFRLSLTRALADDGHRVTALAPADGFVPRLLEAGLGFEPIAIDAKGLSPTSDARLLARYVARLRRLRPDVLLCYTAKPNIYGSLAAHLLGIPVINNVAGLGTAFIRSGPLKAIMTRLYRLAFRRSRTVFFQNEEDLAQFVGEGIVRAEQARLLPGSGIDLARFAPRAGGAPGGPLTFLFVGRVLRDKGVVEFVEAARRVRERLPDARFQLLGFVGAENRTALGRAEVEAWAGEGLIEYLGDTEDVRPAIAAADCVVLPSYREGLPRALLEGAAMGKPLIATDVQGCRSVVEHGVNGFLCTVRSGEALAEAMLSLAALTPEGRSEMGAAARRTVEQRFDERLVIARYRAAIEDAVAERRGR